MRDHVLPVAMPGILTGSIISIARAIGETAPLIIVGMIAFVLMLQPVLVTQQRYFLHRFLHGLGCLKRPIWSGTAAAIVVLLVLLLSLNA